LRGRHLLFESASVRERANCDSLAAGLALEHSPGAVETKVVRDHETVDHGFTETPIGFDHALVGASDRVFGKDDPGGGGIEKGLDYYANARPSEEADTLAVRDCRVRVRRPPDFADGPRDVGGRMDVEHSKVLAGEARRRAVFVNSRRSDGKRGCQGS